MAKEFEKLVSCLMCGMSRCALDPADHQAISLHAAEAVDMLKTLRSETSLNISLADRNRMFINGAQVSLDSPEAKKFFLKMRQKGIEKITIGKGVQPDELKSFFADLASSGAGFRPFANIVVSSAREQASEQVLSAEPDIGNEIAQVKRVFRDISLYKGIATPTVAVVVSGLMKHIRRGGDILSLLMPMTQDRDDLFVHSTNVALLSLYQGEHLGFGSSLLHDVVLAAMLHDIGKTVLPKQLLERPDSLKEGEWAIMKRHPEYGAALLSSLGKVPDIAIVVALEHHMNYDGTGYPATRKRVTKQHVISQIVAIADFCAALIADLPHRKALSRHEIMGLLMECAGKEFNPLLVENLHLALQGSSPAAAPA